MNVVYPDGTSYSIVNIHTFVWRVDANNRSCCIDPTQNGVGPPRPDWLQTNSTYLGITIIREVPCNGWRKSVPSDGGDIVFSWFASEKTGMPFRLGFQDVVDMDIGFYSTDPAYFPDDIFVPPSYCPKVVTDPNCSIFH
eukprot:TRINITY_DN1562_c0_g2_i1.p1 TRINITY_DN1562_c0_g2~~TRINITY_DN1562_c0_g2_i1.p1  ORF type:complete len:139 (-),score=14.17 TRINITY_DN1562_c0_g2_i1:43-459(-)